MSATPRLTSAQILMLQRLRIEPIRDLWLKYQDTMTLKALKVKGLVERVRIPDRVCFWWRGVS